MLNSKLFRGAWIAVALSIAAGGLAWSQPAKPTAKGYEVEWVYRVRYGFIDEWWDIYRKYQIPVLDRMKQRGEILDYRIYHPMYHTDEAARWDYRVEITYRDSAAPAAETAVAVELFPDQKAMKTA